MSERPSGAGGGGGGRGKGKPKGKGGRGSGHRMVVDNAEEMEIRDRMIEGNREARARRRADDEEEGGEEEEVSVRHSLHYTIINISVYVYFLTA
jgi:hypothetical protein